MDSKKLKTSRSKSRSKSSDLRSKTRTRSRSRTRTNSRTKTKTKSKTKNNKKTIYYFYADYCDYCTRFDPLFNKLKRKYRKYINFKKIDGENPINKQLMEDYEIKSYPTLTIKGSRIPYVGDREEKDLVKYIKSSV